MAEKDVTIKREVKETLEKIEKVGQTLINLANLRQLYEEECDSKIVQLTVQQLFDFGCAIDAGVDSIYHHLKEARPEADPLKPLAAFVTKPEPAPEASPEKTPHTCFTLDQVDVINLKLNEALAMAEVLEGFGFGSPFDSDRLGTYVSMMHERLTEVYLLLNRKEAA